MNQTVGAALAVDGKVVITGSVVAEALVANHVRACFGGGFGGGD